MSSNTLSANSVKLELVDSRHGNLLDWAKSELGKLWGRKCLRPTVGLTTCLWMRRLAGLPFGYDLAGVLVKRSRLRNQFNSLFELRIVLQRDLEAVV